MKNIFKIIICLFVLSSVAFSQQLRIHTSAGTDVYNLADIDSLTFSVQETGSVTDIDGNVYETIKIGSQWWMLENLKVTHYQNGDEIPQITDNMEWKDLTSGAYCIYNNQAGYVEKYGLLYNWFAASDERNIAPEGWHIPTDADWKELEVYLGMSQEEADTTVWRGEGIGNKLKEAGISHWNSLNINATNESGFTALPGGIRSSIDGTFDDLTTDGYFWTTNRYSSNLAWMRRLNCGNSAVFRSKSTTGCGFSVRCVKD